MRKIGLDERRARLGLRQHLHRPSSSVESVVSDVAGLHSSDPATVFLSAWARVRRFEVSDLESVLYEARSVVRMLGMRRTMFVVPVGFAPVMNAACTKAYVGTERARMVKLLEDQGVADDGAGWLDLLERETLEALDARGAATAAELTEDVPDLGGKLSFGEGKKWAGTVGLSTRVLFLLATQGLIVRGPPRGSWVSSQYRWVRTDTWLDGGLPEVDEEEARTDLARCYLKAFGPCTMTDIKWWTGWTVRQTKEALTRADAVEVELADGAGFLLADDLDEPPPAKPWVALLPGLDPTVMGWKERAWYLGDHQAALFDRNGNAGPTVWWNGRIVGGWAQRNDGAVAVKLLGDMSSEAGDMIDEKAARLSGWLDETRITPRFRTPLEKELSGS